MYRFIHAADLHLDAPFRGLVRRDPEVGQRLRDASLQALDALVDAAVERACHFVLLSGDVYDGLERGARAQVRLRQAATRLHDHGIRLLLLHGNHDPVEEGYAAVARWPELTTIIGAQRPEVHTFEAEAGRVTVTGQSYPERKVPYSLAESYPAPQGEGLHVAMLHTELDHHGLEHPYSPCVLGDLVATGFHYWALGHIHDQRVLHASSPVVAYPGNLQGRHFGECGPRGALFVSGEPHHLSVEPLPLAPVTFHRVTVDVTELGPLADVVAALTEQIPVVDGSLCLLRAELRGRSEHRRGLASVARAEWLRVLQDAAPDGVWWADVRMEVGPSLDLDTMVEEPTLAGAMVRHARSGLDVAEMLVASPELRELPELLGAEGLERLLQQALARALHEVGAESP